MKQNFASVTVFLIFAFLGSIAAAESKPENTVQPDSFIEEAPGVFVRYGLHQEISSDSVTVIANHGFVAGEKSVAIIDPGGSLEVAKSTLQAVKSLVELPVSHVIVTHVHPDHSLGLTAFAELDDVVVVGHAGLAHSMLSNLDFFKDFSFIGENDYVELSDLLRSGRMQSVESTQQIDLGNRTLTLQGHTSAHSTTDLTILDTKHNILWAGDLLFVDRLPALDGSLTGWLDALTSLDKLKVDSVIPGHGRIGPWQQLIEPQRNYLTDLLKDTRKAIKQGTSLTQYLQLPKNRISFEQWQLHDRQHQVNKSRAYTELEWE